MGLKKLRITPIKSGYAKKFIKAHNKRISRNSGQPIVVHPFISDKAKSRRK